MEVTFLEITYRDNHFNRDKEIRIISCEQICGQQIRIDVDRNNVQHEIEAIQDKDPARFQIQRGKNIFKVQSPNSTDITITQSGHSPWFLIRAHKTSRKQTNFLFLNQVLWGLEISSGLRMKKSCETHGPEKIAEYITKKVNSIFTEPEQWQQIEFFYV
ncbi:MAG: hypothetical protein ACTSYI_10620 [Promethearchaeota archaeon]